MGTPVHPVRPGEHGDEGTEKHGGESGGTHRHTVPVLAPGGRQPMCTTGPEGSSSSFVPRIMKKLIGAAISAATAAPTKAAW